MPKQGSSEHHGECRCGGISVRIHLSAPPGDLIPRRCDCAFCGQHDVAYVSDPAGRVEYGLRAEEILRKERQDEGGVADFLFCRECGVLAGVLYTDADGARFSAVNSRIFAKAGFAAAVDASPRLLTRRERIDRWKNLWFPQVKIGNFPGGK